MSVAGARLPVDVEAQAWTLIAVLVGGSFGALFWVGGQIGTLGGRIDSLGARIDTMGARIDLTASELRGELRILRSDLGRRLDAHLERHENG